MMSFFENVFVALKNTTNSKTKTRQTEKMRQLAKRPCIICRNVVDWYAMKTLTEFSAIGRLKIQYHIKVPRQIKQKTPPK
jgi:hypothetical protein